MNQAENQNLSPYISSSESMAECSPVIDPSIIVSCTAIEIEILPPLLSQMDVSQQFLYQ